MSAVMCGPDAICGATGGIDACVCCAAFRRRWMRNQSSPSINAAPTTPPTTPPAMAPVLVEEEDDDNDDESEPASDEGVAVAVAKGTDVDEIVMLVLAERSIRHELNR